ncbi:DUF4433 domain-containing protein [Cryobacterium tagatosivorans]|uniref:DUF4433 domain-containing protein n=1 Tax=Cryobacterium tagatosivorans TaxID=1259199 RepID=UPI00141A870C|nr:DUF4433 domain-containing protein [Cryobacterium tagatosivorans]
MNDECIHGLEGNLCDQCFPKAAPVATVSAPVSRASSTSGVSKRASRAREASAPTALRTPRAEPTKSARAVKAAALPRASAKKPADVGEQRIYHVTHISNLAGVLSSGALLADASKAWEGRPAVDISSDETRESRRSILVSGQGSLSVAKYVPFFLSPDATVWDSIRAHTGDPRLALDAHGSAPFDFVILVSTIKKALDTQAAAVTDAADVAEGESGSAAASVVATDGDATGTLTRFGTSREDAERLLRILRADPESPAILEAEFLVEEAFPYELVTLIGVANDRVRDVVKPILAASSHRPKVAVYPPWFQASEESAE